MARISRSRINFISDMNYRPRASRLSFRELHSTSIRARGITNYFNTLNIHEGKRAMERRDESGRVVQLAGVERV
jgi:hypothetical protein